MGRKIKTNLSSNSNVTVGKLVDLGFAKVVNQSEECEDDASLNSKDEVDSDLTLEVESSSDYQLND